MYPTGEGGTGMKPVGNAMTANYGDETDDGECEHEWEKSLHEGPLFDEILMICTKCGEYEE
jgi:hypothetical protein